MKELIAIVTCHSQTYRARAQAQRETWAKHAAQCGYALKFFLGRPPANETPAADEVFLDADDGYAGMPSKVQAVCKWARANGYDYVFKTDDDVYVNLMALRLCAHAPYDYVGRFRAPSGGYPADYASGFAYWLSAKAMDIIASAPITKDTAEDRWVGNVLAEHGVQGYTDDHHYLASYPPMLPEVVFTNATKNAAAWCEYPPHLMRRMYKMHCAVRTVAMPVRLRPVPLPHMPKAAVTEPYVLERKRRDLSDLCVLVKTFLRDGYLFDCVAGLQKNFPEVRMVIIDDGMPSDVKNAMYDKLRAAGHTCEYVPYDSGFGHKANYAIPFLDRNYVLIGSDDFDFTAEARFGVERMFAVASSADVAVASGRVSNNPYEYMLIRTGDTVREEPIRMGDWLTTPDGVEYKLCDLTVNYSVIRTSVLGTGPAQVCWDGGDVKIGGGEHGAFYLDLKRHGHKVAFVPGASIDQMRYDPMKEDPTYQAMRGRARKPGRICLRKRGIRTWILADGTKETT